MRKIDIKISDQYGDLTVISEAGTSVHGDRLYKCQCKCGNFCVRKGTVLKIISTRGGVCSCGCKKSKRRN